MKQVFYVAIVLLLCIGFAQAEEVPFVKLKGHSGVVCHAVFSPDGKKVMTGGTGFPSPTAESVRIWDVRSGKELQKFKGVHYADFSPDGRKIAISEPQHRLVRIRDAESGKELQKLEGYSPIFLDNEKIITTVITPGRGGIRIWNIESGKELQIFKGIFSAYPSPNGKIIATHTNDRILSVWDVESGAELLKLEAAPTRSFFSPDGKRIAATDYNVKYFYSFVTEPFQSTFRILDVESGNTLHKLEGTCGIFSPNGKKIASAGIEGNVKIWDVESGEELHKLKADSVLAFSTDGKIITTDDGNTRIWNAESGKELQTLEGYPLALSPDGKRVVTGYGSDGTARIWTLEP